ncbi:MAG: Trk family potassium uptake protein [Oligoflexia bacterium]|nr:Trk family potassium uptake protein [Oligoflexia bacterium]
MSVLLSKIPFILEFFLNGSFVLIFTLNRYTRLAQNWSPANVEFYLNLGTKIVPFVLLAVILIHLYRLKSFNVFLRRHIFSIIIFVATLITFGDIEFCFWLSAIHLVSSILSIYEDDIDKIKFEGTTILKLFTLQPAQIIILTFVVLIAIGTILLMLPISSATIKPLGWVDALFMSVSASCVTGLATISVGNQLSLFGQLVLLMLSQIGGLGIMILYASMAILMGRSIQVKERIVLQDILDATNINEIISIITDIVRYTFFIELWGAIILTIGFIIEGLDFGAALYSGIFHSIMAFCNSGLSLYDNNLENYATKPIINITVAILIILGGIGFVVMKEVRDAVARRRKFNHMTVHSRVVIVTSLLLIAAGTMIIFFGEFLNALDNYTLWEKFQIAFFQSVTTRTAGFNTIALNNLHNHTIYLMGILMFIGGSPGSTAGGIKTSTFATLIFSIKSMLRGGERVEIFNRTIPQYVVVKSTAITILSAMLVGFFIFMILKTDGKQSFLSIYFEVLSAFGTVGLSLGITPYLSVAGKLTITLLMFVGRVGPLTLALAIGNQTKFSGKVEYPEGRIMIG